MSCWLQPPPATSTGGAVWDPEDAQSPGPQADDIDDDFKPPQPGELGRPTKQQERLQAAALARSQESMKPRYRRTGLRYFRRIAGHARWALHARIKYVVIQY
eukprot:COSAG01_NODE_47298_length_391_cov_7.756849_1_plen_102_part_00